VAEETDVAEWRELVHESRAGIVALGAPGDEPRAVARFGSLTCADLGVGHRWGVQAAYDETPEPADLEAAIAWLHERSAGNGWEVSVPRSHVAHHIWRSLTEVGRLPVYAMGPDAAVRMARELPPRLTLTTTPTRDDVIAGYGGWMDDLPLAELLVTADDIAQPGRRFVCGAVDGRVVGCAFVWWSGRTAYLSGIGVLAAERGHGYGWALTAEAARVAVEDSPYGRPDVVWMYATDEGAALYSRMGFERIDEHVSLSDP
jgi:ribosomal protein S18 acetylase RimI-like enzyme